MFPLSYSGLAEGWYFSKAGQVTNGEGTGVIAGEGKDGENAMPVVKEGRVAQTHCWWIPLPVPQGQHWGSRGVEGGKKGTRPQRSYIVLIPENLVVWRGRP